MTCNIVAWNILQYGHEGSEYSTIFIGALGLPRIWSAAVTGGKELVSGTVAEGATWPFVAGCAVAAGRYIYRSTPPIMTAAKTMAMGMVRICGRDSWVGSIMFVWLIN
jgi:hypothetical protein